MNTKNKIADLLIRVAGIAYIFAFLKQKLPMMYTADDRSVYTIGMVLAIVIVVKGTDAFSSRKEKAHGRREKDSRAAVRGTAIKAADKYRKNKACWSYRDRKVCRCLWAALQWDPQKCGFICFLLCIWCALRTKYTGRHWNVKKGNGNNQGKREGIATGNLFIQLWKNPCSFGQYPEIHYW